ncbi:MAG: DUF2079 domain-containing protein, partial [Candidatus Omnitrophota bacterium]
LMLVTRWKFREIFARSCWVRLWQVVCRIPLRYTVAGFFVVYTVMMAWVGFERQLALETRAFDLGIFVQAVWNSTQGDFLFSSIKDGICLLGDHVSPVLALLVPFYSLWPRPELLLMSQAFAMGSCVYLVGIVAKDKLKRDVYAILFALMFFFYLKARVVATIEEFHPEVLLEPFMILAFFYLQRGSFWPFLLSLIVVMAGKENMLGVSFALGIYACIFKKDQWRFIGVAIAILSVGIFFFETKWLMPRLLNGLPYVYNYYENASQAIFSVKGALRSLRYVLGMLNPFSFFPFLHFPTFFLTFPIMLQNILSSNAIMRSFSCHYTIGMHGFLFISTIYAFDSLIRKHVWFSKRQGLFMGLIFFVALMCSGASSYFYFWNGTKATFPYGSEVAQRLNEIPRRFSVLADERFVFDVIHRKHFSFLDLKTPPDIRPLKNINSITLFSMKENGLCQMLVLRKHSVRFRS